MFKFIKLLFGFGLVLFILSGFVWWPDSKTITRLELASGDGLTEIFLEMTTTVDPIIEVEGENSAVRLDFPGIEVEESLIRKAFANKHLDLAYLFNHQGTMRVAGLRLFLNGSVIKGVKRWQRGIKIDLVENFAKQAKLVHASETLLGPDEEKFAPVSICLDNVPTLPLVQELARRADVDIRFSGNIPETVSVNLDAVNPLEALKAIAAEAEVKIEQRQKTWWLRGAET